MKTPRHVLMTGMVAALCCSASAQIIYSNAFNGGAVDINSQAPTYVNPNASLFGGSSGALWDVVTNNPGGGVYLANQNGTLGSGSESVLLPFAPQSGYIYTMSASLTFAIQPPGSGWGALGFGGNFPPSNGSTSDPRFNQALVSGQPWALLNYQAQGGGAVLFRSTSASVGGHAGLMSSLNTPYTIDFVLDTTAAHWSTALYIDSTLVTNYTWTASNPTIRSIGYGQTATTAGAYQWNYLTLDAEAVPEPATPALIGVGLAVMFFVRFYRSRRQKIIW